MTGAALSIGKPRWRALVAPGIAALVAFAILMGLGTWQLHRLAWKEGLIAQIESRAYGEPGAVVPEAEWPSWRADADEFRRVRLTGTFLYDHDVLLHGFVPGSRSGSPIVGYFLFTPLRRADGSIVYVNRGFVPLDWRDPAKRRAGEPAGETTVVGLVRAPEEPRMFVPANEPAKGEWFTRDIGVMAAAAGLDRVAPFYVGADATPNPGGWPKGGQTRLTLPNDHLQYAITWYGIGAALLVMYGAFAWRHLKGTEA